jgi:hypothetical protein
MNNIDKFIKYLDGQLEYHESKLFETELKNNSDLKEKFEKFSYNYKKSKIEILTNETYFNNLIPNVRRKLDNPKVITLKRLAYILPAFFVGFLIIYQSISSKQFNFKEDFTRVIESFTQDEVTTNDMLSKALQIDNNYIVDDDLLTAYFSQDLQYDETIFEYLEEKLSVNDINNNLVKELTDNEFNSLYKELLNKKIIGTK